MNTIKHSAFLSVALCALLAQPVGNAHAGGNFPGFIPFDASQGEFPEGVAADKVGNVYVSIGGPVSPRGEIWNFTPSGEKSLLIDLGTPAIGLAVDAIGNVYVACPTPPENGVWRVDRAGQAVRLPGTEQMVFPDALAFDQRGNLYVTEWFSVGGAGGGFGPGAIWRIPKGGLARVWLQDELLTGLAPTFFPYPCGANGIGFCRGALYVANSDKAQVVRVPVRPDGSPGQAAVWKQVADVPESPFHQSPFLPLMLDGLVLDVCGNVYVAVPTRAAVVRIKAGDWSQQTVAVFPGVPLDAPLSLAFGMAEGERDSLFISNGGFSSLFVPGVPWAGPGLVKIKAGIPGLPLP